MIIISLSPADVLAIQRTFTDQPCAEVFRLIILVDVSSCQRSVALDVAVGTIRKSLRTHQAHASGQVVFRRWEIGVTEFPGRVGSISPSPEPTALPSPTRRRLAPKCPAALIVSDSPSPAKGSERMLSWLRQDPGPPRLRLQGSKVGTEGQAAQATLSRDRGPPGASGGRILARNRPEPLWFEFDLPLR